MNYYIQHIEKEINIVYNKTKVNMKENFIMNMKDNKGVTLLSLAVAVSVMILLIGSVIVISLKDDGVILNAQQAKEAVEDYEIYENVLEAIVTSKGKNGKIIKDTLEEKLFKIDENSSLVYDESEKIYTLDIAGKIYTIGEYGEVNTEE